MFSPKTILAEVSGKDRIYAWGKREQLANANKALARDESFSVCTEHGDNPPTCE